MLIAHNHQLSGNRLFYCLYRQEGHRRYPQKYPHLYGCPNKRDFESLGHSLTEPSSSHLDPDNCFRGSGKFVGGTAIHNKIRPARMLGNRCHPAFW